MTARPQLVVEPELDEPPFAASIVSDALRQFGKAARAQQLYLSNNPMHARAMETVREAFSALWKETDAIELNITDSELLWLGHPVMEEPGKTSDSLPWLFYKDGIRQLTLMNGFEGEELQTLLGLIQRTRLATAEDDDLLTLLWEHEFTHLQYKYVDIAADSAAALTVNAHDAVSHIASPRVLESAGSEVLESSSIARMDDYDTTLYFLDDAEVEYLQREIRDDFASDLRTQVVASLLDTYEQETDPTVREEIAGILDQLFLLMLSLMQFRTAAFIIRESRVTASRALEILQAERDRLTSLADRLSDNDALELLLTALEQTRLRPPQHDLHELFGELKPSALASVLGWIGRSRNTELRALLENAGSRMAASHTAELVRLIASSDDVVAFEAMRRAGSLKAAAAVPALAGALSQGPPEMRMVAVTALSQIGSPGAMQVLERALEDEDSDVRIAAVKVLASSAYTAAAPHIEAQLRKREARDRSLAEKMAFFESYGSLCGDAGVGYLDSLLNARRFIGKKEPPELRACAAMALGKIGTDLAMEALQKSGADPDVIVRNAVSRAVRSG
jgi:HEAT repeat protein